MSAPRDIPPAALRSVLSKDSDEPDDQSEGRAVVVYALFAFWFGLGVAAGIGACKAAGW